jgi:hypothetical protein
MKQPGKFQQKFIITMWIYYAINILWA